MNGEPGTARFFFALWPDPRTQSALETWGRRWALAAGARATTASSIHMTLAFLGDMAPDGEALNRACRAATSCPFHPFTLVIDCAGYFREKRLGWLAPEPPPQLLIDLAGALRSALTDSGVSFDRQAFVPHVTVLRGARRFAPAPASEAVRWEADSFALMASVPSGGGRAYRKAGEWPSRS